MGRVSHAAFVCVLAVTGLATASAARAASCAGLTAAGSWAAGPAPQMVQLGDFNGDGRLDVAVANGSGTGNTLDILLGLPGGGFAAPIGYTGGTKARALATGDLDGDGRTDIVLGVNAGVMLWLGNGDGTFHGGALVAVGSSPRGIVCADLDGDGITDLVVASSNTASIYVLRGNGANAVWDGTYAAPIAYPAGTSPARLVSGDWNGDGILDVACTNDGSHTLSIFLGLGANGRGDGTFTVAGTYAMPGSPLGLVAGDFDHDGITDLAVSDASGSAVTIMRGTGNGAFVPPASAACAFAAEDLACADIDGDGIADLAVACAGAGQVSWLRGKGDGSFFAPVNLASGAGCYGVAAGDVNGDGIADVVTANTTAGSVTRLLGACAPTVATGLTLLAPNAGDAWWPGQPQVVRWQKDAGVLAVDLDLSRDGGATWTPLARNVPGMQREVYTMGATSSAMRVRVRDAVVATRTAASSGDFRLCGRFGAPITQAYAAEPATLLATGDMNGDGIADAVTAGATTLSVFTGDGAGGFALRASMPIGATTRLRLADADHDGRLDVVLVQGPNVVVMRGDGAGGLAAPVTIAMPTATLSATVSAIIADATFADLDEDGVPDLVAACGDAAQPVLVTRRGLGDDGVGSLAFAPAVSAPLSDAPLRVACADMDGDGITDVVVSCASGLQIWYGNGIGGHGDGTLAAGVLRELSAPLGDIAIGDLDGDGHPDVLACVPATGDVWMLAGAGAPASPRLGATANAFAAPLAIAGGAQPQAPCIADFDGDGLPDVAVTLAGESAIALLPGVPSGAGASLGAALRYALPGGARALALGDFTHAGAPGLLALGADSLRLSVLPAQCPPQLPATIALLPLPAPAVWGEGREVTLSWTRAASIPLTRVEASRDDGRTWSTLADGVAGTHFTWSVTGPVTDSLRIRVSDAAVAARYDTSPRHGVRALLAPLTATIDGPAALPLPAAGAFTAARLDGAALVALTDGATAELLQAHAGAFTPLAAASTAQATRVLLADVDRDGREDLLTLSPTSISVRRRLANDALDSTIVAPTTGANADLLCRDVDGDGVPDVIVASGAGAASRVQVLHGAGDGGFTLVHSTTLPATPTALAAGDLNGDGAADLLVTQNSGISTLLAVGADGMFQVASTRSFGNGAPREPRLFDLDGDGALDLVALDGVTAAMLIAHGDGAGHFADPVRVALPGSGPLRSLAIADLDGDGHADLAVTGDSTLTLIWNAGIGITSGGFVPVRAVTLGAGARLLGALDTDGDGIVDLVTCDAAGSLRTLRGGCAPQGTTALQLSYPTSGSLVLGQPAVIAWTAGAGVAAVDVDLSRDGGAHWESLAQQVQRNSLHWTVTGPVTGEARLRVRDAFAPMRSSTTMLPLTIEPAALAAADVLPARAALSSPWPSPARGATTLMLSLPAAASARVEVCDVSGRRIATLANRMLAAGEHALRWDGRDATGATVAPGLYFIRAEAGAFHCIRRVVELR